ncbi:unnamed protein product [Spirodela intermedia]|uniref:Uncharacterized protein n=1 Tax=Spirodela intermedia TaxID=51605 RepID=A0A7I8LBX1_SPIIN|nr:unnamed protein product [Spirodela intermedia]
MPHHAGSRRNIVRKHYIACQRDLPKEGSTTLSPSSGRRTKRADHSSKALSVVRGGRKNLADH